VGNDYPRGNNPVFRTKTYQALLEPDLAYNFWAEQKDVDPSATAITVVLDYSVEGNFGLQKVAFRKMPIK
jgi:hypothetical protein